MATSGRATATIGIVKIHRRRQNRPMQTVRASADAGFTLVEMLIVILVVGILAAIALPAYNESVQKSRRSDAMSSMTSVQQALERWRGSNPAYTTSFSYLNQPSSSQSGYYTLSIASPGEGDDALSTGYILTATANTGTSQANDADCGKMSVKMLNGNLTYAGGPLSGTLSYGETHACFAR
jgi:type IV pilus assembly protein PilE